MSELVSIQNQLAGKLSAGINLFLGIRSCHTGRLDEFICQQVAVLSAAHQQSLPPGFAHSRRLYNSLHIDPTRHRPSSEALWRRLRDKKDFPRVNPQVDLTNLLSLKFQICYGLYDLEQVHGPVTITLGDENDQYQGIRKETLNFKDKIVLRDARGAFGNPSADSLRASVNQSSPDIMQVLFFHAHDSLKEKILAETLALFRRFFTMEKAQSFFLETNSKQVIFQEGETCKTSASQTRFLNPN